MLLGDAAGQGAQVAEGPLYLTPTPRPPTERLFPNRARAACSEFAALDGAAGDYASRGGHSATDPASFLNQASWGWNS